MNESFRELEYFVKEEDVGMSIRDILSQKLHFSGREITRCKQFEDSVMLKRNSMEQAFCPALIKTEVFSSDTIKIRIYEDTENAGDVLPSDDPIDIVYEDEDIILLNKPGNMVVHPSYSHYTDSLSNALKGYYLRTGQNHVVRAIGRLDRETSGLILFAKNRYAASVLSEQKNRYAEKNIYDEKNRNEALVISDRKNSISQFKEYLAIAFGVFEKKEGTISEPIARKGCDRMLREVNSQGREAVTHYCVEKQCEEYALVRLKLDTGRTHQIRVHLAYIGHPLLGDSLYGNETSEKYAIKRAALHAGVLRFVHPVERKDMFFRSELPSDMSKFFRKI